MNEVKKAWDELEEYLVKTRYSIRDPKTGEPVEKTYDEVVIRIINALKEHPKYKESEFFSKNLDLKKLEQFMRDRILITATPFLLSFGNPYTKRKGYFSCYPLGHVKDSMKGIDKMCEDMQKIYMSGGGAGIDTSKLRGKGNFVDSGQGIASGPVGFLPKFEAITGSTNQGGRRRGALLNQLDWNHPNIHDYINAKASSAIFAKVMEELPEEIRPPQNPVLSNVNISVNVFGKFWEDKKLLRKIAENMWASGDPGLLFVDNTIKHSSFRKKDNPRFSNPCGEYLAPAMTACNLLTVNAGKIARQYFDLANDHIRPGFLNQIVEVSKIACMLGNLILQMDEGYPLDKIREQTQKFRPVGVGMSGFHTALILAFNGKVPYGSEQACAFAGMVQAHLTCGTLLASAELTNHFGLAYENSKYWNAHLKELNTIINHEDMALLFTTVNQYHGFYNACTTSQAPTGSVSQFLRNIDTGIEPFYEINGIMRKVRDFEVGWREFTLYPMELYDLMKSDPLLKERVEAQTSDKISPEGQLKMLASFQKFIHTGVSKTVNVPYETTTEEVEDLVKSAKNYNLKGFTVYRIGSRDEILKKKGNGYKPLPMVEGLPSRRKGETFAFEGPYKAYITINHDSKDRIRELFIQAGNIGASLNSMMAALGMILSVSLTKNPELIEDFINTLSKIQAGEFFKCSDFFENKDIRGSSLPDLLSKILEVKKEELTGGIKKDSKKRECVGDYCPECQNLTLKRSGGCKTCDSCGYSTC